MTLLSLLRRCLPAKRQPLTLTDQLRALWGTETTADIRYAEADPAKVQIKPRRAALRRAS